MGLLYGKGDFTKTYSISTRAGDDSDCNPGNAGGILGTMKGYDAIPKYWKEGLPAVEDLDFKYTTVSLNDAYDMSFRHALQMIERNGGEVRGNDVIIQTQKPKPVRLEQGFEDHYPIARRRLDRRFNNEESFEFEGVGLVVTGGVTKTGDEDYTFEVNMFIDGELIETVNLPTNHLRRRPDSPFWRYKLPRGKHLVRFEVLNPSELAVIHFDDLIIYDNQPPQVTH